MISLNTRRPHDKCPANEQTSEVADDLVEENVERPPGKKAEKEYLRKRKSQESCDAEFHKVLAGMIGDRRLFMAERRAWMMKANHDRGAQLELDKKKFEVEMMSKDLASMNAMQQAFFLNIQRKIYEDSFEYFRRYIRQISIHTSWRCLIVGTDFRFPAFSGCPAIMRSKFCGLDCDLLSL
ncbi:uncharacterized protein LOC121239668 [Juglans microcarpa x Juglans regia]|uniref:uncharacterized protein LOC121239668 n=1 Tax=Juglans microcarpa x Juglans regia TaxID=2249226 RepID=UPI001B7F65A7|nr:uncharacterized protein LOC121239668 [Juglans microcarpa x Juglans regia]